MILEDIKETYSKQLKNLSGKTNIKKLEGSLYSFLTSIIIDQDREKVNLFIFPDKETASYYFNDFQRIFSEDEVLFMPSVYRNYDIKETDNIGLLQKTEVLNAINKNENIIIVSYAESILEKIVHKKELEKNILRIEKSQSYSLDFITEMMYEYGFNFVDFISEPGQFALRGGIVDIFSYSNERPFRIEFFGDEVDTIREFEIESQLSVKYLDKIEIIPNIQKKENSKEKKIPFFDFLPENTRIFFSDINLIKREINNLKIKFKENYLESFNEYYLSDKELEDGVNKFDFIEINTSQIGNYDKVIEINSIPQPVFNKDFNLLKQSLEENYNKGIKNIIFFIDEKQKNRFSKIFEDIGKTIEYKSIVLPIYRGFIDLSNNIACYTDHQIFERYYRSVTKENSFKSVSLTMKELTTLQKGDYVVHINNGIGKYGGIHKIDVGGIQKEAVKIEYAGGDIVYVSIHSLHKISKYNLKEGKEPVLHKLGSKIWENTKNKSKKRVKEIAYDLVKLYAERKSKKGFSFSEDNYLQYELEASFMYEDTEDQAKAWQSVKDDMEKEIPMDRLICGDVGFGKTEVAIRAAFKAINDNKQVVILVPTTILALQHFRTFTERLKNFPVTIDYINRFRSIKEKNEIINKLQDGKIDIIIGTHALISDKIVYKDLGLLIVDEEQKFGVAIKDKLKMLKVDLDTLTLTATPIPRTLQFSLMSARDLSIIATPPVNRYPIQTNIIRFDTEIIKNAIIHEVSRGGQVFFIHNKIKNLQDIARILTKILPNIKIAIGHGQMDGKELENIMIDFMEGEYDLLLSTTIVESGLDVPNANTIIINDAHNFGISDLHQMRGRVGRSNKKAYCYFISPSYNNITSEAKKRLEALQTFSDLGQGFNIAMKDLEIRGAGDLLGGEQSGFMDDIGFETYEKILSEAMIELRESDEFREVFNQNKNDSLLKITKDISLDTDFEAFFPDDYINSHNEKLVLYKELSQIDSIKDLKEFKVKILDRFGIFTKEVETLFKIIEIKFIAQDFSISKLIIKNQKIITTFYDNIQEDKFSKIIDFISKNKDFCKIEQNNDSISLEVRFVKSIDQALEIFRNFKL